MAAFFPLLSMSQFASGDQLSSLSDAELNKQVRWSELHLNPVLFVDSTDACGQTSLKHQVHISLEETETMWLLDLTPSWVPDGSEEAENVKRENKTYQVRSASSV